MTSIHGKNFKLFSGNANKPLAKEVAALLGRQLGNAEIKTFSDEEIAVSIYETVRGMDVFVIQSLSQNVNKHLMELLIMIDAFKRASAGRINAVIPYYGYARQDRKAKARDPITAKLLADIITAAGAHRVLTMDLHAPQIQGFFNIPVDHLLAVPVLAKHYIERNFVSDDLMVVSPDLGSVTRSRNFASRLGSLPLAIIDKRRPRANVAEVMNIIGDVKDKRCILIDDLLDTGGTFVSAANALLAAGAKEIYACCTHGVLSGPAIENIQNSPIKELLVTNTVFLPAKKRIEKISQLSIAPVFAEAIERIYKDISVSPMFD